MRPGVKGRDLVIGGGEPAGRRSTVAAHVRLFLRGGEELPPAGGQRLVVDLRRREAIAGLRYGLEGMCAGGRRELVISPHLAYGKAGVPGRVPPDAVLRAEVELLEVRPDGQRTPEDAPPGRHLFVFHPGEAARGLVQWQFGLDEGGRAGLLVTFPRPDGSWRRARRATAERQLDDGATRAAFAAADGLAARYPGDVFPHDDMRADPCEPGHSITRHHATGQLCLTVGEWERGAYRHTAYLAESSAARRESPLFRLIDELLAEASTKRPPAANKDGPSSPSI